LTKETAIVFPAIIFFYEWVFGERERNSKWRGRLRAGLSVSAAYLVVVAIYIPVRLVVLKGFGASTTPLPLSTVILTLPSLLWFYIKLLIWPFGLSAFYNTTYTTSPGLSSFILPAMAVAIIGLALWFWSRKSRVVAFACAWLVLPLSPVLNVQSLLRDEIAHDRYLFLPSVGFSILVAVAITRFNVGRANFFGLPASQVIAVVSLCAVLGCATALQHSNWANELVLFERGVESAPNNRIALNNLGSLMLDGGRYDRAINLFRRAVDRNPDFRTANLNLGKAYCYVGQYEDACEYLSRAIELDPKAAEPYLYLAISEIERGRFTEGRSALEMAEKIRKDTPGIHFWRGMAYKKEKALPEAMNEFRAELEMNPANKAALMQISEVESEYAKRNP
jgi:Tfp pilus assembly protein PilF